MRPDRISNQLAGEPWQADAHLSNKRSAHAGAIIEMAHTLAAAETAVLKGDGAKAMADLKRLQADTLEMLDQLERTYAPPV